MLDSAQTCTLGLVGRKGKEFFSRRGFDVMFEQVGIFQKLRFEDAQAIAQTAMEAFLEGRADRVMLVYNEFRSVMTQRVVVDQLLPIARGDVAAASGAKPEFAPVQAGGDSRVFVYRVIAQGIRPEPVVKTAPLAIGHTPLPAQPGRREAMPSTF